MKLETKISNCGEHQGPNGINWM